MPINIRYTHRLLTSRIGNIGRALGVGVCHRYPDQGGTPKLAGPEQYHAGTVSDTADTSSPSYLGVGNVPPPVVSTTELACWLVTPWTRVGLRTEDADRASWRAPYVHKLGHWPAT